MHEDLGFGKLITTPRERDAVHVAVAPVVAGCLVNPADRVGFLQSGRVGPTVENIGIVDPYLTEPVLEGQTFWLFLFPNTVTGLRHHWSHPAFGPEVVSPESGGRDPEGVSRRYFEGIAKRLDVSVDLVLAQATTYQEDGERGGWRYEPIKDEEWPEFWRHFEVVTGRKVLDPHESLYRCCA